MTNEESPEEQVSWSDADAAFMARALELARKGRGFVEPNPMVGALVVREGVVVGEGSHQRVGGPHAEIHALEQAGESARGSMLYVTLEPCCHWGRTGPCTEAVIKAGVSRVVCATTDPFEQVSGKGVQKLREAGVEVAVGLLENESRRLNAPYLKLVTKGLPWVVAKWAMTLDGKIATRSGESQWITGPQAREYAHQIRGYMDAIVVGIATALADDPLLTARPPGPRTALRVVLDSRARLSLESRLVRTARDFPTLVVVSESAGREELARLSDAGCEHLVVPPLGPADVVDFVLKELGRRKLTNVLVEGGARVLGSFLDGKHIDEVHVYIAGKLFGGSESPTPIGGLGVGSLRDAMAFELSEAVRAGDDWLIECRRSS